MGEDLRNVLTYLCSTYEDPDWKRKDAYTLAKIDRPRQERKPVNPMKHFHHRPARRGNTTILINKVNIYYN